MLSDFRSYGGARSRDRGPARRPMRRERRRQDQSPRSAVAVRSRARPAPGGASAECARVGGAGGFALSIEIEEDGETHQLGSGWKRGRQRRRSGAAEPHRPRGRRLLARLLRPCADRLADAGDGFAVRRAGEPSGAGSSTASCWRSTPITARGSASSSGRCAGATGSWTRAGATPPGSTRSSARRPSSASPSPPRGSNACAGSRR